MGESTTLGNRYEIGEVLGRGGMAEVHVGRDVRLGRQVAVKMLRVDLARDPSFQARFRREAQSAAALNHPSIVAVYDTGEDLVGAAPVPYIVMEYVDGSTLRDLLNSGRRLLPERALEIVAGVLEALDYSHRHGIVHRDIKPANVMLTRSGDIKVMDFGIARAVADSSATMTQTSAVIGTAQYLSPEQARGETVDTRSDLYSTGCLLFELLTGRPPFVGDSPVAVAYQHVREEPQPPSAIDPDVPAAVDAIVLKSLVKNKEERYQSAAEMRADIERALAGRPVEAPAVGPVTQRLAPVAASTEPSAAPATAEQGRRVGRYLLLALAVLVVFLLSALAGQRLLGQRTATEQVRVPAVEGLAERAARNAILAADLLVGRRTEDFSDRPAGTVVSQSPPANTSVETGTEVALVVSAGQELTTAPTLVGLSRQEATDALAEAQLELGRVTERDSAEPVGQVLRASVSEGEEVTVGSPVDLVVSTGNVRVPDVVGEDEDDARSELQSAGFDVDAVRQVDAGADAGTVIAQSPRGGQTRRAGTTVEITVATAPPPPEPTVSEEPTPEPTPPTATPAPTTPPPSTPTASPSPGTQAGQTSPSPSPSEVAERPTTAAPDPFDRTSPPLAGG